MVIYAPYYKRILSSLIDTLIFYFGFAYIYFFHPESFDLKVNSGALFIICIFYHYYIYKTSSRTFGEHYLGIKTTFTRKVKYQSFLIFLKAIIISSVYFPMVLKESAISFVIGSIILQFYPKIRAKKILLWDLVSNTVVIDEKESSNENKKQKNERKETLKSNEVVSDNSLMRKGKFHIILVLFCLIFLELYKGRFSVNGFQLEQLIKKGFIIFYLSTLMFLIYKGMNWAKWLLSISCFLLAILLIPPAIFQIFGQLENPSPLFSKIITFTLSVGLPIILYIIMGFKIIKSRSIIAFMDYQRTKIK